MARRDDAERRGRHSRRIGGTRHVGRWCRLQGIFNFFQRFFPGLADISHPASEANHFFARVSVTHGNRPPRRGSGHVSCRGAALHSRLASGGSTNPAVTGEIVGRSVIGWPRAPRPDALSWPLCTRTRGLPWDHPGRPERGPCWASLRIWYPNSQLEHSTHT